MEVFNRNSDLMIEELKKFKPKEAVDVNRLVTLSTLDIICGKLALSCNFLLNWKFIISPQKPRWELLSMR